MMSTKFVHNNTHVGFLLMVFSRIKDTATAFRAKSLCILLYVTYEIGPLHIIHHTKWNIFKTKQENKNLSQKLLSVFNDLSN
jgi:hypothetical protein